MYNFLEVKFLEQARFHNSSFTNTNFANSTFQSSAVFYSTNFLGQAYFSARFNGRTRFNYVMFEVGEKVHFDVEYFSKVSFMNSDITRVRFSEKTVWGSNDRNSSIIQWWKLEKEDGKGRLA